MVNIESSNHTQTPPTPQMHASRRHEQRWHSILSRCERGWASLVCNSCSSRRARERHKHTPAYETSQYSIAAQDSVKATACCRWMQDRRDTCAQTSMTQAASIFQFISSLASAILSVHLPPRERDTRDTYARRSGLPFVCKFFKNQPTCKTCSVWMTNIAAGNGGGELVYES